MKAKNLFFMALAGAALCACSSEDLLSDVSEQKVFENDKAYMVVSIKDVGSLTRATSPTENGGFEYGTASEYSVSNAYFYFYDAAGDFVSEAEVWDGGEHTTDDPNIDFKSKTVIVLKGLTQKNYPKYMVTVLNRPDDFTPAETLDEMQTELISDDDLDIITDNGFAMSTSSFKQDGVEGHYFVSLLDDDNFMEEPIADDLTDINAVDVYVERLAAKVTVNTSLTTDKYVVENSVAVPLYPIEVTVAGDANDDSDDQDDIGADNIYIKLLGWKLEATAKHSNVVKNLGDADFGDMNFTWNDPTDHRSYWGESFNYGINDYPTTEAGAVDSKYLDYYNLVDVNEFGTDDYCAENTNTASILNQLGGKYSSAITSVLVKAEICDGDGNGLNLVRFNGELYQEDDYLNYALNYLTTTNAINAYYQNGVDGDGNTIYSRISADFVELYDLGDGKVGVKFHDETNTKLYARGTDSDGNVTFTEITDLTTIENALEAYSKGYGADANSYNGGLMYYLIPIEHLNNIYGDTVDEANYGVVRNHHYVLTINELKNLGRGVYDPEDIVVPNPDDYNDTFYYVGANINILSWKLVEQSVSL